MQTALADLRTALKRPLGHSSRPTAVTFAEELERVRALHPDLEIVLESGTTEQVPANLEALAQSILVEAVRNARKHAHATFVGVSLRNDGATFVLEVRNDGAHLHNGGRGGRGPAAGHAGGAPARRGARVRRVRAGRLAGATRGPDRPVSASAPASQEPPAAPEGQRRLRVLVVDDHDVVHWGFRLMLGQMPWVDRCLSARTGAEALAVCRRYEPHVALVDLFLGGESGPEICERLRAEAPAPRVLLMSGAGGISPRAARGGRCGRLHLQGLARPGDRQAGPHGRGRAWRCSGTPAAPRPTLTDRESEILGLIAGGATNREIAGRAVPLAAHGQGAHEHALSQAGGAQPGGRGPARPASGTAPLGARFDERARRSTPQAHGPAPHLGGSRRPLRAAGGGGAASLWEVSTGVIAGLFPGQGSHTSALRDRVARVVPGLLAECIALVGEDPFARVGESTRFAQPAIFCASVAGWKERPAFLHPIALAGHSLGELSALVAAGALHQASGLRLAVRRGELMACGLQRAR